MGLFEPIFELFKVTLFFLGSLGAIILVIAIVIGGITLLVLAGRDAIKKRIFGDERLKGIENSEYLPKWREANVQLLNKVYTSHPRLDSDFIDLENYSDVYMNCQIVYFGTNFFELLFSLEMGKVNDVIRYRAYGRMKDGYERLVGDITRDLDIFDKKRFDENMDTFPELKAKFEAFKQDQTDWYIIGYKRLTAFYDIDKEQLTINFDHSFDYDAARYIEINVDRDRAESLLKGKQIGQSRNFYEIDCLISGMVNNVSYLYDSNTMNIQVILSRMDAYSDALNFHLEPILTLDFEAFIQNRISKVKNKGLCFKCGRRLDFSEKSIKLCDVCIGHLRRYLQMRNSKFGLS